MRSWTKSSEPADFATWRAQNRPLIRSAAPNDWSQLRDEDNRVPPLRAKSAVREQLCDDQRFVCAYCESRIGNDPASTTIEHFEARTANPARIFDWWNMVGVCTCGEAPVRNAEKDGLPLERFCEPIRGALPLHESPYGQAGAKETHVRYTRSGRIESDHPGIANDIATLNLNHGILVRNRRDAFEELHDRLEKAGAWSQARLKKRKGRLLVPGQPAPPYLTCLLFHIDRWLKKRP